MRSNNDLQFEVRSLSTAMDFNPYVKPHAMISVIPAMGSFPLLKNTHTQGVLFTPFEDDESSFTQEHADQIIDFVTAQRSNGVSLFLVNCLAGVSRSAAVCAALSKFYKDDDAKYFRTKRPNMHVYRTLLNRLRVRKESHG